MNRDYVQWREQEGIAVVTINRPPVNALNARLMNELIDVFEELGRRDNVRVVVLSGAGKAFIAGADLTEIPALDNQAGREFSRLGQRMTSAISDFARPVLAAVEGMALGGGCEVALACDIRVASEAAVFGQPEVKVGVIAGAGGTQRLPRLVGTGTAKLLSFTGETIVAPEAWRIGLVEKVVPAGEALREALALAAKINANSPAAVSLTKQSIDKGINLSLQEGLRIEQENFGKVCDTEDKNEGVRAFLEKRKPVFRGS